LRSSKTAWLDTFVTRQGFGGRDGEGVGVGLVTVVCSGVGVVVGVGARVGASGESEAGAVAASVCTGVGELASVETGTPVDGGDGGATSPVWLGKVRTPSEAVGWGVPHPAMRSDAANSTNVRRIAVLRDDPTGVGLTGVLAHAATMTPRRRTDAAPRFAFICRRRWWSEASCR
jgi:hypothetical protein